MTKPKHAVFATVSSEAQGLSRWLPFALVQYRYDKSDSSLRRWWTNPAVGFPKPTQFVENGPLFWSENTLDEFDARRAAEAASPAAIARREEQARIRAERAREHHKKAKTSAPTATWAPGGTFPPATAADRHVPAQQDPLEKPYVVGVDPPITRPTARRRVEEEV